MSTLFLSHSFLCLSHFLLMLFFAMFFLVIPVQIRFQSNGSDIGLARPPIEPLTGTERVDAFLRFLYSDLFFSPTEKALVWRVLLLWCLPERMPRAVIFSSMRTNNFTYSVLEGVFLYVQSLFRNGESISASLR